MLAQMAALYEEHQCSIVAVQEVPSEEVDKYGVVAGTAEDGLTRVARWWKNPRRRRRPQSRSDWPLHPDARYFRHYRNPTWQKWGVAHRRAQAQAREGRVLAYQFEGLRFDCGSVPGFVEATQYVFEHYYGQPE